VAAALSFSLARRTTSSYGGTSEGGAAAAASRAAASVSTVPVGGRSWRSTAGGRRARAAR
jgi:hypothetical protein